MCFCRHYVDYSMINRLMSLYRSKLERMCFADSLRLWNSLRILPQTCKSPPSNLVCKCTNISVEDIISKKELLFSQHGYYIKPFLVSRRKSLNRAMTYFYIF